MHIAVFGGTGRVGGRFIEYALAEGHTIKALARDPRKLAPRPGLTVVQGDVLDAATVASVIAGADAVVSGLGGAGVEDPGEAQSQGMRNIIAGMQQHGVRRVLGVAGGGILNSVDGACATISLVSRRCSRRSARATRKLGMRCATAISIGR